MIKRRTITDEQIEKIKLFSKNSYSIRECARAARVSYYTAWNVINGGYDTQLHLKDMFSKEEQFFNPSSAYVFDLPLRN